MNKEEKKALEGTVLLPIFAILNSGKFLDRMRPAGEDEEIVGKMTDIEKAVCTYIMQLSEKARSEIEAVGADPERNQKAVEIMKKYNPKFQSAHYIFSGLLHNRFPDEETLEARADFKLVRFCSCDACKIAREINELAEELPISVTIISGFGG